MANERSRHRTVLSFETLETRDAPSATPLVIESFDHTAQGALPTNWVQWSNNGTTSFAVSNTKALSGQLGLTSNGTSSLAGRAWLTTAEPADLQVSAAVYLNNLVPLQVLARGSNLATTTPTYYAVTITRGLQLQLQRVVNGTTQTLATLQTPTWTSDLWVQVTLSVVGNALKGQVYNPGTGQYLNSAGKWQTTPAWALSATDGVITGTGQAGISRPASYSGSVSVDDFSVVGTDSSNPVFLQPFNQGAAGSLPVGWSQWSSGASTFGISGTQALSGMTGLASVSSAAVSGQAWLTNPLGANEQVTAAVYLTNSMPAQVLARGSNLAGSTPTYYAVSVTQGMQVQLVRVVNGVSTTLAQVNSATWLANQWVRVTLTVKGNQLSAQIYRLDTLQYLTSAGQWQSAPATALTRTDSAITNGGLVGLGRPARQAGTLLFDDFLAVETAAPAPPPTGPVIPQHLPNIRIAELAYDGLPLGTFEDQLLKNDVDLVVPSSQYLGHISSVAPNTPLPIYTNTSNIYGSELTDWLNYADAHGLDRESSFYHVTQPTAFSGDSPSSQPVNWFWGIFRGGSLAGLTDLTVVAHDGSNAQTFGALGESVYVGYPDRFREINITLASPASGGWSAVLEYPTAVDAFGNPTAWATLSTLSNTTAGLTRSGTILFDPPAHWVAASVGGSARLFYVRFRTVTAGTAPTDRTILGRDYTGQKEGSTGVIPVFDYAADTNHDGYLNDAEYAQAVKIGDTARFAYESRLLYNNYGEMRFATNPSTVGFRNWAADYEYRYLNSQPQAQALFMDNSAGNPPAAASQVRESLATYTQDYGTMLKAIDQKIAPRWILANVDGSTASDPVIQSVPAYFEEFAIRPLASTYQQFEDLAAIVVHRANLASPAPYAVLDSLPRGGSPTDPRTQIATLAYYYMIGDPKSTFLMFYGGYAPSTSWTQHWVPAAAYNIGQPLGNWSVFATGLDPENRALTYRVYQRQYGNALVLYKPLSAGAGGATGTLDDATGTTLPLNGTYRPLRADGTLGAPETYVNLRNGEGAILVKA